MGNFTVRQAEDKTLTIKVFDTDVEFIRDGHRYYISLSAKGLNLEINLTGVNRQLLAMESVVSFSHENPDLGCPEIDTFLRRNVELIYNIDDIYIKLITDKCHWESILYFCWMMDDKDLTTKFTRNMSTRARDMFLTELDELQKVSSFCNATESYKHLGREALIDVLHTGHEVLIV